MLLFTVTLYAQYYALYYMLYGLYSMLYVFSEGDMVRSWDQLVRCELDVLTQAQCGTGR